LYFSNAEFGFTSGLGKIITRKNSIDENDWETDKDLKIFVGMGQS
jgi:hypothetical protein